MLQVALWTHQPPSPTKNVWASATVRSSMTAVSARVQTEVTVPGAPERLTI
jgi:hypothetical protein